MESALSKRYFAMNGTFIFALTILLSLAAFAVAFSSEEVKGVALVYSTKDEAVIIPSEFNPVIYKEDTYWYAYLSPQDAPKVRNLVMIVKQTPEGGILETREDTLRFLYSLNFDLETLQLLKDRGVSFDDLKNVMESLKFLLENSERPVLENIKRQSDLDFINIEDALSDLETAADDSLVYIDDGRSYSESFKSSFGETEVFIDDLNIVFDNYDSSIDSIYKFVAFADRYQKAVSEKQLEVAQTSIAGELAKLGNLKVKDSVLKSYNASLSGQKREYDLRKNRKASLVNDTMSSFYFRKSKLDAQSSFDRAKAGSPIESLLATQNQPSLRDCKLSSLDLKKKWDLIRFVMDPNQPHTTQEYQQIPAKVNEAASQAENLNARLSACLSSPATVTPQPPQGYDWKSVTTPLAAILIIILAAYYLNNYFKRKPEEDVQ